MVCFIQEINVISAQLFAEQNFFSLHIPKQHSYFCGADGTAGIFCQLPYEAGWLKPSSVEMHQAWTFEGCSTDWATALWLKRTCRPNKLLFPNFCSPFLALILLWLIESSAKTYLCSYMEMQFSCHQLWLVSFSFPITLWQREKESISDFLVQSRSIFRGY